MINPSLNLDLAPLRVLSGGDQEFMREILEMILTQSPLMQERMIEEMNQSDLLGVERTAHKYKSSLQILGNHEIIELVQQIEHLAGSGKHQTKLVELIEDFNQITDTLLEIIREELLLLTEQS